MNREIKFRGKNKVTNEWIYGGYYKHLKRTPCPIGDSIKDDDYISLISTSGFSDWNMLKPVEYFAVDEKTVGQYTGLKDKKGIEIYEGDIIKVNKFTFDCKKVPTELIVAYELDGFVLNKKDGSSNMGLHLSYAQDCEVIGNVHDNQELLVS